MTIEQKIEMYREDFDLFETDNEKIEYIFDLAKKHTALSPEEKSDETFIEGCASPAWLVGECRGGKLVLRGEGTSEMAKGMLVLLLDILSDRDPEEILSFDPSGLERLGVVELLSPVRRQSLGAFLEKVYSYAKKCVES